jgi:hypothetical protein
MTVRCTSFLVVARSARMTAAALAAVAIAAFAATTGAHAAPTVGICKAFSVSGAGKIQWSAIGSVTCQEAKPWLVKILSKHGAPDARRPRSRGARGAFTAVRRTTRRASRPWACYTGTIKFPKNGFQWFG